MIKSYMGHDKIERILVCGYVSGKLKFYGRTFGKNTKDKLLSSPKSDITTFNTLAHAANWLADMRDGSKFSTRFKKCDLANATTFFRNARPIEVHTDIVSIHGVNL